MLATRISAIKAVKSSRGLVLQEKSSTFFNLSAELFATNVIYSIHITIELFCKFSENFNQFRINMNYYIF